MSHRSIRRPKARLAVGGQGRTAKGWASGALAALAVSAVLISGAVPPASAELAAPTGGIHAGHDHAHLHDHHGSSYFPGIMLEQPHQIGPHQAEAEATLKRVEEEAALKRQQEEDERKRQEEAARIAASTAVPVARDSYSLGARWGATGAWSRYHTGQDLSAPVGTPVYAVAPGVVGESDAGGWAGVHVIIKHTDGSSLYAHLANMTVNPGQQVKAGDRIGTVGLTGRTFGAHLHFEFYPNGAPTNDPYSTKDPYKWLEAKGVRM